MSYDFHKKKMQLDAGNEPDPSFPQYEKPRGAMGCSEVSKSSVTQVIKVLPELLDKIILLLFEICIYTSGEFFLRMCCIDGPGAPESHVACASLISFTRGEATPIFIWLVYTSRDKAISDKSYTEMTLTVRIIGDVNLFLSGWHQFK